LDRGLCKICGRFFLKKDKGQESCEECYSREEKYYHTIKEFLKKHRNASIMDIYLETKIPLRSIERFIEEKRVEIVEEK